jgi:hypothetical protein
MKALVGLVALGCVAGIVYILARLFARWGEKRKAAEERFASFIAQARPQALPTASPQPLPAAPEEQLLLDAGAKAGQAGEPALAIQLYTRLLARYPQSRFASQAQAGVVEQQKKLARA